MKKLVIFLAIVLLLSSCGTQTPDVSLSDPIPTSIPTPTPSIPEVTDNAEQPTMSGHGPPPDFFTEEDFLDFMLFKRSGTRDEDNVYDEFGILTLTHYYKLKNPPPETTVFMITLGGGVNISYLHAQAVNLSERIMIRYSTHYSFDIETDGLWTERPFPEESHIIELEGIKYYIRKVTGLGETILLWSAEWYNEDGYYMSAELPYRFTVDEVLGLVSDIERVEIG